MGVLLTYHGHSCFTVSCKGYRLVIDPYAGHVPGYAPLNLCANEVLCSHEHKDHSFTEAVELISGDPSPFTVTKIEVPHDDQGGVLRGMTWIHIIECEGIRVAHFGDIGCELNREVLDQLHDLDAVLIPVGGVYTIDAAQARKLADTLNPQVVIPMHYRLGKLDFEVIATLDEFISLCSDVVIYDSNEIMIEPDMPKQTAVLQYLA